MTQQQTERDEALIAEAERLATKATQSTTKSLAWIEECQTALIHLVRTNWTPPAKPDRYLQVWKEAKDAYIYPNRTEHESDQVAAAVLRKHFEPPSEVVEAAHTFMRTGDFDAAAIMAKFLLKGGV